MHFRALAVCAAAWAGLDFCRHRHRSHEVWRDGKLTALRSEADDDGHAQSVSVHPGADGPHFRHFGSHVDFRPDQSMIPGAP